MNKCLVFDLDGTVLNTLPDILGSLNILLNKLGLRSISEEETLPIICFGARRLIVDAINVASGNQNYAQEVLGDVGIDNALAEYVQAYAKACAVKTAFYEGIEELLFKLKGEGYKLAILTNKTDTVTQEIAKVYFKEGLFDLVVGQSSAIPCKPDKGGMIYVLEKLNGDISQTIMIGDGETDHQTSVNAGVKGICVTWGYRSKQTLQGFGAKTFANNAKELYDLIKKAV